MMAHCRKLLALAAIGVPALTAGPLAAADEPPPLAAYDGLYPHDTALQPPFLDHPLVRQAVADVIDDDELRLRILDTPGPKTPIRLSGDRIHSWGCEQHRCGPHNWTISLRLDGSEPAVCYHNADTPEAGATWYFVARTEIREFHCPSES